MELHISPPDVYKFIYHRKQMQECLICAVLASGKMVTQQVEMRSEDQNCCFYWVDWENNPEQETNFSPEHIEYHASIYQHHTNLPPERAVLVERIEYSDNQISASWQFQEKQECNRSLQCVVEESNEQKVTRLFKEMFAELDKDVYSKEKLAEIGFRLREALGKQFPEMSDR